MEWLTVNGGAIAGFGATGVVVIAGVLYAIAFQRRFTNRMEKQGDRDVARIEELEGKLDTSRARVHRLEEYATALRVQIINLGGAPHPPPPDLDPLGHVRSATPSLPSTTEENPDDHDL